MPTATVAGLSVNYEVDDFTDPWREAEVVYIQHGIGRSARRFYHWVPLLAGRYRVVRSDWYGHGKSEDPGPDFAWTPAALVDHALAVLDDLGVEKVHYIGDSGGGLEGLALAAMHPDRLLSLTVVSSPTQIVKREFENLAGAGDIAGGNSGLDDISVGEWARKQIESGEITGLSPEQIEWTVAEWDRNKPYHIKGLLGIAASLDLSAVLPRISVPTLVLSPVRSHFVREEHQDALCRQIRGAIRQRISGQSQELFVDMAEDCVAAFKAFVRCLPACFPDGVVPQAPR